MGKKINISDLDEIIINPGDLVIDCGANVGKVTDYFSSKGAKVIAFEPNQFAFSYLKEKFKYNPEVDVINKGVAGNSFVGKNKLFLHQESINNPLLYSSGSSIIEDKNNINKDDFQIIEIIDLSQFIKDLNRAVKLLKIDIEGAEIGLLNDLIDQRIIHNIPYVIVETHDKKIPSLIEPTKKLRKRIIDEKLYNINLDWV